MRSPSEPTASSARGDASPSTASASQSSANSASLVSMGALTAVCSSGDSCSSWIACSCLARTRLREAPDFVGMARRRRTRAAKQRVGDAAHRGGHDGHLMALGAKITNDVGRLADGLGAADGCAAELDDETLHRRRDQRTGRIQRTCEVQGARCRVQGAMLRRRGRSRTDHTRAKRESRNGREIREAALVPRSRRPRARPWRART